MGWMRDAGVNPRGRKTRLGPRGTLKYDYYSPDGDNPRARGESPRDFGDNPRDTDPPTNPRAMGTNPRALKRQGVREIRHGEDLSDYFDSVSG